MGGLTTQCFEEHRNAQTSNTFLCIKQEACTTHTVDSTVIQMCTGMTILCRHCQKDKVEMCDNEQICTF